MQKVALPVIFVCAAAAALFYVGQEEHGTGTLVLLAAVLLVGQICATLPFIFDSAKKQPAPAEKAVPAAAAPAENSAAPAIIGNQKVIQTDLRSLGEALIKRLNALAERIAALEKSHTAPAVPAENPANDFADELDELFEKIRRELDEKFDEKLGAAQSDSAEKLNETLSATLAQLDEKFARAAEKLTVELRVLGERIDDLAETVETLRISDSDDDPAADDEEDFSEEDSAEEISETEEAETAGTENGESVPAETEAESAGTSEKSRADFPPALGATLVLNAMIGIGNKPFLRGNAPGLSETAGAPMEFAEIGRWKFDFEPTNEEFTVRILRNDDENELLGEPITLAPGQTLEIALR